MQKLVTLLLLITLFSSVKAEQTYLVSYELIRAHTKDELKALWKSHKIPKIMLPVHHAVDIYEIVYNAKWIDGTFRKASGIVYVPKMREGKTMPTMMFGHGTELYKGRKISDNDAQQGICVGFATDGYLALYPDYFGLGKGEGNHLYQHAESEANAYIYMLYAVEELKQKINIKTNGQLFLTGYSQGGHSSFAAQKYIEALNDPRFKVTATSPMSGAYDMTGEQQKYMFQEYPRPFYLPYLLVSYQEAYHVLNVDNIYKIFKSPFDTLLPKFYTNNYDKSLDDLDKIMPKIPKDVVLDSLVNVYIKDPDFLFTKKLKENCLTDWKPQAPVQLCYCKGDREVNYKNSEVAYNNMKALGVTHIKLNNLSDHLDHNTCALFAVLATKYFFDRYKKHGDNPKMKDLPRFKKALVSIVKKKEEAKYMQTHVDKNYVQSRK